MAAIGSQSIAMVANQLVPMLANLDSGLLLQMLQVANPALATALSAYCLPATNPMQVPHTTVQTDASSVQLQAAAT